MDGVRPLLARGIWIASAIDLAVYCTAVLLGLRPEVAHVVSLLLAAVPYVLLERRVGTLELPLTPHSAMGALASGLLLLALRGGVLGFSLSYLGIPPIASGLLLLPVTLAAFEIAGARFSRLGGVGDPTRRLFEITVALGIFFFLLRLAFAGLAELLPEEGYYRLYGVHLSIGYLDHPPMVGWTIALFTSLVGDSELGIRVGAILFWLVGAMFLFLLTERMYSRKVGLLAVSVYGILPYPVMSGFLMTPDAPLVAFWLGALYFLYRAFRDEDAVSWFGAGACIGLGMVSKYTIALVGVAAVLFVLTDRRYWFWLRRYEPYAAALLSIGLFFPVVYWNATHEWASFAFQSSRRLQSGHHFSLHWLFLHMCGLVLPTGILAAWAIVVARTKNLVAKREVFESRFTLFFFMIPASVFVVYSLRHVPKMNWTGPSFLVLIPMLSAALLQVGDGLGPIGVWLRRIWVPVAVTWSIAAGLIVHYLSVGLPLVPYSPKMHRAIGWKSLAAEVDERLDQIASASGQKAIIVGMDKHNISSQLAFYLERGRHEENPEVAGRDLFGRDSLMFLWWGRKIDPVGRTMVMVGRTRKEVEIPSLHGHFDRLGEVEELQTEKYGWDTRTYFLRVGYGYRPLNEEVSLDDEDG